MDKEEKPSSALISEFLESVDTPDGRERLALYLKSLPFPHYEQAATRPGFLVRIYEDGTRQTGRFVNRKFES
jgi:hypothetical protein